MEKALKENGDKLPEEDKAKLDDLIKEAKESYNEHKEEIRNKKNY